MAKAKDIRIDDMISVSPVGDNQKKVFEHYKKGKNMFLYGAAGTGKTLLISKLFEALKLLGINIISGDYESKRLN